MHSQRAIQGLLSIFQRMNLKRKYLLPLRFFIKWRIPDQPINWIQRDIMSFFSKENMETLFFSSKRQTFFIFSIMISFFLHFFLVFFFSFLVFWIAKPVANLWIFMRETNFLLFKHYTTNWTFFSFLLMW